MFAKYAKFVSGNLALAIILFLAAFVRFYGLFPNTFNHQDEPLLIATSRTLFQNIVLRGNFDTNLPPHPFKYGSSMFYAHAAVEGAILTGAYWKDIRSSGSLNYEKFITNDGPFKYQKILLLSHRFLTALLGLASVFLLYQIAKQLFNDRVALFSALILSVNPFHVRDSHYATVDVPQLFFILLAFLFSIFIWKRRSIKWHIWAGFMVGFSASIKYFPIALLPLLYFHYLAYGDKLLNKKLLLSLFFIPLGFLASSPFILFHINQATDMIKLNMEWYEPKYAHQFDLAILLPRYLHQFHLKFLFTEAFGPILGVLALLGIVIGLKKWFKQTAALLLIPLPTIILINLYLQPIYERLSLPTIPFLAVLASLCLEQVRTFLSKIALGRKLTLMLALILLVVISPSLKNSYESVIACGQDIADVQSINWIKNNLKEGDKLAYQPGTRIPEIGLELVRSEIGGDFSLSELQKRSAEYLVTTSGYLSTFSEWSQDYLFLPEKKLQNQYHNLVEQELNSQAKPIVRFEKPSMCVDNKVYVYKIPPALAPASILVKQWTFDQVDEFSQWKLNPIFTEVETAINYNAKDGHVKNGSLEFTYNKKILDNSHPVSSLVRSPVIGVISGKSYSLAGTVKRDKSKELSSKDGFFRLDFYSDNLDLPILTLLTAKADIGGTWQVLQLTGVAPKMSKFARIGFQAVVFDNTADRFLIDDIKFFEK